MRLNTKAKLQRPMLQNKDTRQQLQVLRLMWPAHGLLASAVTINMQLQMLWLPQKHSSEHSSQRDWRDWRSLEFNASVALAGANTQGQPLHLNTKN
jgi:hypothetical protein